MSFGAAEWFWGFLLLPVLVAIFFRNEVRREVLLRKLVAARLLANLAASTSTPRRRWKFGLALLGLVCVIAALTQPRVGYQIEETHRKGLDLLIAVDTSKSMLSTDVQPDRLTRAKYAAQDLLDALDGDRVGLIAFAGTSFVQAPLTIDYSAVLASLTDLDTNTIPRGGTNIAGAIREASDAFGKGESTHRALVLFTDGEELEDDAIEAAKEANGKFRIFTIGVGTREGSLIPAPGAGGGTEFVKDPNGQYVKSKLDEEKLKAMAQATGGFYVHLENGPATAKAIIDQGLRKMQAADFQERETHAIERFEWPLAAGILLLTASALIRERRRVTPKPARPVPKSEKPAVAAAAAALLLVATVHGWSKNEGLSLYDQENYKGAYDVFQDQLERNPTSDGLEFDSGAAAYKEQDYDKALDAFGKVLGSKDQGLRGQAEYNLGNTLVQRGALQQQKDEKIKEWKDALTHYDQALKVDPKNVDAKYNGDLVRKMIEELNKKKQQQQQQQQSQQQKNQSQQNQQNQNQQNQSQQNQAQQNQQKQQGQNQQQKNDQQQNQQAKNQPQQNQQNQQPQNQPQQNQDQNQQQKAGGQDQQNQPRNGQQNQPQNGQQKPDEQNQPPGNQNQNAAGASPTPTPANGPGKLKENSQKDQQSDQRAAALAATEQGRPGEMTPSQAQALIDSMRGEDEHVNLYDRQPKNTEESYKDW